MTDAPELTHEKRVEWLSQMLEEEMAHKGTNTAVCADALRHAIESERILVFEEETGVTPWITTTRTWHLRYHFPDDKTVVLLDLERTNPNGWPTRREAALAAMKALGVEV